MRKTCRSCGFANSANICLIKKISIDLDGDACQKHQREVRACPICGHAILKHSGTYSNELNVLVCNDCATYLYKCVTCKHNKKAPECVMNQYHGTKPIFIHVQGRQGPFVIESQQLNPEVLEEVCPTCTCGSPYNCQRNFSCNNWESAL